MSSTWPNFQNYLLALPLSLSVFNQMCTIHKLCCALDYVQTADGRASASHRAFDLVSFTNARDRMQRTSEIWRLHGNTFKRFSLTYSHTRSHKSKLHRKKKWKERQTENGLLILALSTNRLHTQNKCFSFFLPFEINEPEKMNMWYAEWRTATTTKLPKLPDWRIPLPLVLRFCVEVVSKAWRNKTKRELTGWL